jgi:putative ABC transport system permease protein
MATRELLRRPRSFFVPVGILLLLALLLLYPSAILDGILDDTSAAIRNAPADLIVYSKNANGVILRSQIEPATRQAVAAVPGADQVASFDVILFTGRTAGHDDRPVGLALQASDRPIGGQVPATGEALADESLRGQAGIGTGSEVLVGPLRVPVKVVGFTHGTNLWFAGGFVVDKATWLATLGQGPAPAGPATPPATGSGGVVAGAGGETAASGGGGTAAADAAAADPAAGDTAAGDTGTQALLVRVDRGADPARVARAIDQATGGKTQTLTRAAAVRAMPGVEQQESTFGYIRLVTLTVALVVVGLFLSFMTLERAPLYAVLKAIGASSRQLFVALIVQVMLITIVAVLAAAAVTWGLTQIPFQLPTVMRPERLAETLAALSATAVVGSTLSLRKVVRVDPADAIG